MKLVVACLMVMIALSSAEDDMLKELDEELLFDILQQKEQKSDNDGNACANKPNGDYADPADCAKYITCSNGQAITDRNCPGGLYFNPKTSACDYPKNVDCKSKGSGDCSDKSDGNYPDPNNCFGFIMCSNGMGYHMNCPSNLKYDKNTKQCEHPDKVVCSASDDVEFATDKRSQLPSKDPFCRNRADGNYVNPYECEGFIMCSNHLTYFFDCPSILQYNPKTDRCDWPRNVNCGPTPKPTKPRPQPPAPTPSPSTFCKNRPNGNYVDPNNCNGFIMCSNHLTYFFDCPSNLRYNAKTDRCDWPRNVKCGPTPAPTAPPTTAAPVTPSPSTFCKYRQNGNYVDPNNCNGFIMCSNHLTYFFDCPSNLRYNAKTDRCDWPRNVKCGPTPAPTKPQPPAPTPSPSTFCKNRPNGNYVDPNNCNGFIMCSNHLTYFFDCPANLRYNAKTDRCDWPRNVKCGPTPKPQPPAPTPSPSTFCKNRPNGNYVDPNNCNGFIMCSNHLTYFFDCPSNLRYNAKTDRCDWPRNVKCPPKMLSDALRTTNKRSKFCKRHGNGDYRDTTNCEGYFSCYFGYQIFRECPGSKRFNPLTRKCDLPRNVKCGGAGGGTRGSGFCKNKVNGDYKDVLNCNGFIKCSNSYTYYFDCPSILRFNLATDRCDWPRNVRCSY